jgi:hypothetical protein
MRSPGVAAPGVVTITSKRAMAIVGTAAPRYSKCPASQVDIETRDRGQRDHFPALDRDRRRPDGVRVCEGVGALSALSRGRRCRWH